MLTEARATAEQVARDAQAHADRTRRDAEKSLSDARATAAEITKGAQTSAAELERQAQQRYDEIVGTLETERTELQQQIEALQQFDRDYRSRLRAFMHDQLNALGPDEPPAGTKIQQPGAVAPPRRPSGTKERARPADA